MAVPKRRTSKRTKRARNTHKAAPAIALQACPQCSSPKRPHRLCDECGYYAGELRAEAQEA
jgi:large subunit ribosomal protein L32